ncbi:MAG: molybdopterin-dependent oxidoreductase, partial [Microthrixaceae bacterium]|nr:molybdopterin-dependent oxidoreductase [Microthrixaceae bacterium]
TARYGDLVLPATTQVEHLDLGIAWGHLYLSLNQPAIEPVGDALPNTEIFRRLAAEMGLTNPGLTESDETMIRSLLDSDHPWMDGITFESLEARTWQRLNVEPGHRPNVDAPPDTDDQRLRLGPLRYQAGAETPPGAEDGRYPLALISRKQHLKFLNANYAAFPEHQPAAGRPLVQLHRDDAVQRGIDDGDEVRVFNDRGAITLQCELSDDVQPGLVAVPFGWWHRSSPEGRGVNALTNPTPHDDDDVGSAAFHDTLVEVRPV